MILKELYDGYDCVELGTMTLSIISLWLQSTKLNAVKIWILENFMLCHLTAKVSDQTSNETEESTKNTFISAIGIYTGNKNRWPKHNGL